MPSQEREMFGESSLIYNGLRLHLAAVFNGPALPILSSIGPIRASFQDRAVLTQMAIDRAEGGAAPTKWHRIMLFTSLMKRVGGLCLAYVSAFRRKSVTRGVRV